jgi:hypothetical protein
MKPPSEGGVALGYLCPCGKGATTRCAWCYRALCGWHSALGPFEAADGVKLRPVCHPRCNSPWWQKAARADNGNAD